MTRLGWLQAAATWAAIIGCIAVGIAVGIAIGYGLAVVWP